MTSEAHAAYSYQSSVAAHFIVFKRSNWLMTHKFKAILRCCACRGEGQRDECMFSHEAHKS